MKICEAILMLTLLLNTTDATFRYVWDNLDVLNPFSTTNNNNVLPSVTRSQGPNPYDLKIEVKNGRARVWVEEMLGRKIGNTINPKQAQLPDLSATDLMQLLQQLQQQPNLIQNALTRLRNQQANANQKPFLQSLLNRGRWNRSLNVLQPILNRIQPNATPTISPSELENNLSELLATLNRVQPTSGPVNRSTDYNLNQLISTLASLQAANINAKDQTKVLENLISNLPIGLAPILYDPLRYNSLLNAPSYNKPVNYDYKIPSVPYYNHLKDASLHPGYNYLSAYNYHYPTEETPKGHYDQYWDANNKGIYPPATYDNSISHDNGHGIYPPATYASYDNGHGIYPLTTYDNGHGTYPLTTYANTDSHDKGHGILPPVTYDKTASHDNGQGPYPPATYDNEHGTYPAATYDKTTSHDTGPGIYPSTTYTKATSLANGHGKIPLY